MNREEARAVLLAVDSPPLSVLRALRAGVKLGDSALGYALDRSPQTVRRWRKAHHEELPLGAVRSIESLRSIVATLLRADFEWKDAKGFLLSRNIGLGRKKPLDGIRVGGDALRQVEYVTECFIAGIAPEPPLRPLPSERSR
jgi:hypothetical protein